MACRLFSAKPLSESFMVYCSVNWITGNKFQWNFNHNWITFIQEYYNCKITWQDIDNINVFDYKTPGHQQTLWPSVPKIFSSASSKTLVTWWKEVFVGSVLVSILLFIVAKPGCEPEYLSLRSSLLVRQDFWNCTYYLEVSSCWRNKHILYWICQALTHWGWAIHIWMGKLCRCWFKWWGLACLLSEPSDGLLLKSFETKFNSIYIKIQQFSSKKMYIKMSPAKEQPFCLIFFILKSNFRGMYDRFLLHSSLSPHRTYSRVNSLRPSDAYMHQ